MKRRQAIRWLSLLGGSIGVVSGYQLFSMHRQRDMNELLGQRELLAELVDVIIPPTDTPGAKEAGVHDFVLKMMISATPVVSQNRFMEGLKLVQAYSLEHFARPFSGCTPTQRVTIMRFVEEKDKALSGIAGKVQQRVLGKPFFQLLKEYTSIGYCTSFLGATQALRYVPIPARFSGCIPLEKGQPVWATK